VCNPSTGACMCDGGWHGAACAERSCAFDCHGHGLCSDGQCFCEAGWEGAACGERSCPNRCSAHGACLPSSACACFEGWQGEDCSVPRAELLERRRVEQAQPLPPSPLEEMRAAAHTAAKRRMWADNPSHRSLQAAPTTAPSAEVTSDITLEELQQQQAEAAEAGGGVRR
jgi:hypothetical protein